MITFHGGNDMSADFHELNALVANFLRAYERLKPSQVVSEMDKAHARPECVGKEATTPHAALRKKILPRPVTPRLRFDEMEAEIVGQLEHELPKLLSTSDGECSRSLKGISTGSMDVPSDDASARLPSSDKRAMVMTRTLDHLLAEEVFKRQVSPPKSEACNGFLKRFWEWWRHSPGEEVLMKAVEPVMGVFIVVNCILIAVSLDTEEWGGWYTVDCFFAGLYSMELMLRLKLLGWRDMYLGVGWRWSAFDTLIVIFAIVDLFVQASGSIILFRVLRFARLSRLLRVLRLQILKELAMLVRGMAGGSRCLVWCMFFLFLPVFFVGMILSQVLKDWGEDALFSSVPAAMFTTFRCMCGDCTDNRGRPIINHITRSRGWYFAFFYAIFILVTSIGLFNLITALFIEVTMHAAKNDEVLQSQNRKAEDKKFAKNVKSFVFKLWVEHENMKVGTTSEAFRPSLFAKEFQSFTMNDALNLEISAELYQELVTKPHIRQVLDDMGLSNDDIVNLFDILDVDRSGTLDLKEMVNGLHKLRGDAKKLDLVALSYIIYSVEDGIRELNGQVARLCESRASLEGHVSVANERGKSVVKLCTSNV